MEDIIDSFKRYSDFKGRSTRNQFWNFFALQFLIAVLGATFLEKGSNADKSVQIFLLILTIPYIAVSVRRMHDINKSGWFILIPFYNLFLFTRAGDTADNMFGEVITKDKKVETKI